MVGGIDLGGLVNGTVVQPKNDVVVIVETRASDGHRFIGVMREDRQRASGIERKTSDRVGVYAMLIQNALD